VKPETPIGKYSARNGVQVQVGSKVRRVRGDTVVVGTVEHVSPPRCQVRWPDGEITYPNIERLIVL
jgi:hypothetical protein